MKKNKTTNIEEMVLRCGIKKSKKQISFDDTSKQLIKWDLFTFSISFIVIRPSIILTQKKYTVRV